jgi:hypothetical protein
MSEKLTSEVRDLVSSLQRDCAEVRLELSQDKSVATAVLEKLNARLSRLDRWKRSIKFLEDVPGIRVPKWYTVDIPYEFGESESKSGEVIISPEGPFVCSQMQVYYLCKDDDVTHFPYLTPVVPTYFTSTPDGRTLPCSAYAPLIGKEISNLPANPWFLFTSYAAATRNVRGNGWNYPEFEFQIEVAGSGRYWAGDKIPAAAFYGGVNPLFAGIQGVVEQTDRLVVRASPTTEAVNMTGVIRFVFHGYQIQGNINLTHTMGY